MAQVLYRDLEHDYPIAVVGEGCWLTDSGGKRYLDGSGGAAVSILGHGNRHVVAAIKNQAEDLCFSHTAFFSNEPQERLAARLSARFQEKGSRVYFTSGGSEATETALKLARQFHIANGESARRIVISRDGSYHGATLGALAASGTRRRLPFEPLLANWPRCAPCYAYRHQKPNETELEYGHRSAETLRTALEQVGPENVAAFIAEPIVGSTLGAVSSVHGYFPRIREICNEFGVLLICDEVMSGAGRTGSYLCSANDCITPDIVILGKGLGAGYQPLGAVIARARIHESLVHSSSLFDHGFTYGGHPVACAAGNAVLDQIEAGGLLERVESLSDLLLSLLADRLQDHPNVGDIRGRGLLAAIEFVEDKDQAVPLSADRKFPVRLRDAAMGNGLICYPDGGNIDGHGAHVLLAPPIIASAADLEQIAIRLALSVNQLLPDHACA